MINEYGKFLIKFISWFFKGIYEIIKFFVECGFHYVGAGFLICLYAIWINEGDMPSSVLIGVIGLLVMVYPLFQWDQEHKKGRAEND